LLDYRDNMTPSQADKVLQWARSGGHLLFVAEQLWDETKGRRYDLFFHPRVARRQTADARLTAPTAVPCPLEKA
ncbi:DUF4350 domain-containing protein, partial [Pseudomonas quasicaspiana]|nr:DUF4350 domain-containing protein [Pseudomonas quasicaspiana]